MPMLSSNTWRMNLCLMSISAQAKLPGLLIHRPQTRAREVLAFTDRKHFVNGWENDKSLRRRLYDLPALQTEGYGMPGQCYQDLEVSFRDNRQELWYRWRQVQAKPLLPLLSSTVYLNLPSKAGFIFSRYQEFGVNRLSRNLWLTCQMTITESLLALL